MIDQELKWKLLQFCLLHDWHRVFHY